MDGADGGNVTKVRDVRIVRGVPFGRLSGVHTVHCERLEFPDLLTMSCRIGRTDGLRWN